MLSSTVYRRLLSTTPPGSTIGFIGLGNMGASMALNLLKAGFDVKAYDLHPPSVSKIVEAGGGAAKDLQDIATTCPTVITMLPSSPHVSSTIDTLLSHGWATHKGLLIDSSTIDPLMTRELQKRLGKEGVTKIDAPVSGGVKGAAAGTLTFMVGAEGE